MQVFEDVLLWIANNVFNEVAILIGLITAVGLILLRKPIEDVISGALRATIGIYVLFIGVNVFVGGLVAFQTIVAGAFNLDPPTATASMDDFLVTQGSTIALIITVGFFFHAIAVRLFRLKYIYLTGHLMFWMSVVVTAALVQAFGDMSQWTLVLLGSAIVATYWTLQPIYIAPLMRKVIGSDQWAYGHTSSSAAFLAGKIGPAFGSKEKHDTEKLHLPKKLSFFKDVNVSTALVIGVIMLLAMGAIAIRGNTEVIAEQAAAYSATINPWVWGVVSALRFAAGIAILLFGVRMFLAEIVPAFKGVSERLIPGSAPALDCPTVFPYAPTAVMVGFVSSTIVFLALMGVFAAAGWFVLVPPMIMLFFPGGAAGVFGNAVAGWRGAAVGGAINGLFLAFGQWVMWDMLSDTAPELATLADPDWYLVAWLILAIGNPLSVEGLFGLGTLLFVVAAGVIYLRDRKVVVLPEAGVPKETAELTTRPDEHVEPPKIPAGTG